MILYDGSALAGYLCKKHLNAEALAASKHCSILRLASLDQL